MLLDRLERLRQEPVHVRKRFTLLFSLGVTGVIAAVWLSVVITNARMAPPKTPDTDTSTLSMPTAGDFFDSTDAFMQQLGLSSNDLLGGDAQKTPEAVPAGGTNNLGNIPTGTPYDAVFGTATYAPDSAPVGTDVGTPQAGDTVAPAADGAAQTPPSGDTATPPSSSPAAESADPGGQPSEDDSNFIGGLLDETAQ